jgi:acetamidase/formamidase
MLGHLKREDLSVVDVQEKVVILIGFGDAPVAVSAADVAREATVKEKVLKNAINKNY